MRVPSLRYSPDSTDNSSIHKAKTSLEWQEYFSQFQDMTDALLCHTHLSVCLWIMDNSQQSSEEEYKPWKWGATARYYASNTRPCYQRGSLCQDPAGNRTTLRPPDHRKETQTAVVWSCLLFIWSGKNHLARHSERGKKTRQTEEEVGRQHQGMDRPRLCQVPEGSGEHGKMEKTDCEIICSAPMTLAVKGWMMIMMMMTSFLDNVCLNSTAPFFAIFFLQNSIVNMLCLQYMYFNN